MTADSAPEFRAGDRWRYRAPAGFEQSRMLIGAVVSFADAEPIVCCAVVEAPRLLPDGTVDSVNIPFLPLTAGAMRSSVVARDGEGVLPLGFGAGQFKTFTWLTVSVKLIGVTPSSGPNTTPGPRIASRSVIVMVSLMSIL